ncbi:hypothetical protein LINPERHAP1_LOCUS42153 [Linum perenne]
MLLFLVFRAPPAATAARYLRSEPLTAKLHGSTPSDDPHGGNHHRRRGER